MHNTKDDFKDWMHPRLKAYYSARIDYLSHVIDEAIPEAFNAQLLETALKTSGHSIALDLIDTAVYQPMRQYIKVKGKRFRPLLSCLFIEGYGKEPELFKPILAIAEIIHSCSLILDDIADASLLRRGQPCAHQLYGIPRAANASSAMTFFVFRLLQRNQMPLSGRQRLKLHQTLLWEHYITSLGSALDLGWAKEKRNEIPDDIYIQHILFRSSSYTYRHAAAIGAIAAGADDRDLDLIFQYSSLLGVAFQFIDDIFNLKPGLPSWGKTIGEDITEGKRSPLVLHTVKEASQEDRSRLLEILDGNVTDQEVLQEAIGILEKYDAFAAVRKKAKTFIDKACSYIQRTKVSEDYKLLLIAFAQYVVERRI
ncbi:MAG: polyprenyl synthetase family protein [Lewinellaceae bacterium]|nr:polyprenyl synthetase family protein [Lewinellaceae bacterium]